MSVQPRKQRKFLYNAPLHKKRKWISAHMADDLILKYRRRSLPVIRGDTVKIMRGEFKGTTGKVRKVNTRKGSLEIEGVTITKVDGKKVSRPIHASNVLITKLNLTDPWRRRKLEEGLPEEVKEEIEKEAEEQIKIIEEEKEIVEEVKEEIKEPEVKEEVKEEIKEEIKEEVKEEIKPEAKETKKKSKKAEKKE
ncbi:MAG TPA: 50S ribosomal protein L24 [Thermoplasmatales archaeon]|nr:50S ribosomal protein L24 [Thermoplasmatales archaeon]